METDSPTRIFNPGILTDKVGLIDTFYLLTLLNPTHLQFHKQPPMYKSGYIIIDNETYAFNTCLFDSGAQSDNYIASKFVNEHMDVFKPYILEHSSTVRLGDSKTTVHITHIITLNVSIQDSNHVTHDALINLSIMDIDHLELIIGINSIIFSFYDLFLDLLKTAKLALSKPTTTNTPTSELSIIDKIIHDTIDPPLCTTNDIPISADYNNCIPTWSLPLDEISPEELDTPDPCSFTGPLEFLSVDRQEVLNKYYNLLTTNINPDFINACPDVLVFMKSSTALSVFCPETWTGINNLPPLELNWSPELPARMRTHARPIKPAFLANAKSEFDRLKTYFYAESTSPITSPLVIAPKATPPFIRFCGDYVNMNKYIIFEQHPVPIVLHELQKASTGKYFNDFDMKNGFHQFKLATKTSLRLSVLTTWGNFCPLYMPEGVSPASGILNTRMTDIFYKLRDYTIVIFDNFLSITFSFDDCYLKLVEFITCCANRNVILGMAKTKIGYADCTFFGYKVKDGTYSLTQERQLAVTSLSMPKTIKQMQSLLGSSVFFKNNIPNYADLTATLHEMTVKNFSYDPTTWTKDYVQHFEKLKLGLLHSIAVSFPNYNYTFILRTDASTEAWGGVLIQITPTGTYECISLVSAKFSGPAHKWDIHKKEAYGIIGSVKALDYLLRGKYFIIETDHKNILYLEQNITSIVIRWRMYLQTFYNCRRYLQGKFNNLGDWLSRQYHLFCLLTQESNRTDLSSTPPPPTLLALLPGAAEQMDTDLFFTHTLNLLVHTSGEEVPVQVRIPSEPLPNTISLKSL